MKPKKLYMLFSLLVVFSMILAACAPATTEAVEEPAPTDAPAAATEPPMAATEEPAPAATTRRGGWLDEIDFSVVAADSAISQLQAGTIDFYSFALASDAFPAIKEAGLGNWVRVTCRPVHCCSMKAKSSPQSTSPAMSCRRSLPIPIPTALPRSSIPVVRPDGPKV